METYESLLAAVSAEDGMPVIDPATGEVFAHAPSRGSNHAHRARDRRLSRAGDRIADARTGRAVLARLARMRHPRRPRAGRQRLGVRLERGGASAQLRPRERERAHIGGLMQSGEVYPRRSYSDMNDSANSRSASSPPSCFNRRLPGRGVQRGPGTPIRSRVRSQGADRRPEDAGSTPSRLESTPGRF